jgi:hypothetical protein
MHGKTTIKKWLAIVCITKNTTALLDALRKLKGNQM